MTNKGYLAVRIALEVHNEWGTPIPISYNSNLQPAAWSNKSFGQPALIEQPVPKVSRRGGQVSPKLPEFPNTVAARPQDLLSSHLRQLHLISTHPSFSGHLPSVY